MGLPNDVANSKINNIYFQADPSLSMEKMFQLPPNSMSVELLEDPTIKSVGDPSGKRLFVASDGKGISRKIFC